MNVLETMNITKTYGGKGNINSTQALNGISLNIQKGEFVSIMGPSGSGKTTLLNILGGIDKPTSGEIKIAGKSLSSMERQELSLFRRQKLGFVFQEFNLFDSLTLKENVMLPMILDNKNEKEMESSAKTVMSLFDIYDIGNKYPYNVSGGQQQRVAIARALINNPDIIFADEPTGNLDSKSSKAVMNSFMKMNQELGSTILMVTHDPAAASFANKIIFIIDGMIHMEIVKKGNRKEFLDNILDCLAVMEVEKDEN